MTKGKFNQEYGIGEIKVDMAELKIRFSPRTQR